MIWGVFVGLPLGLFQAYATWRFVVAVTQRKSAKGFVWFLIADLAVLAGAFTAVALCSREQLVWTATGMASAMIAASAVWYARNSKGGR